MRQRSRSSTAPFPPWPARGKPAPWIVGYAGDPAEGEHGIAPLSGYGPPLAAAERKHPTRAAPRAFGTVAAHRDRTWRELRSVDRGASLRDGRRAP